MAESHSMLCIYDFFIHSSVRVRFGYFRISAIVYAAAGHARVCVCVCVCVVAAQALLLSCKTETVPTRHSVPFYLPQPLAPTILLSVNMEPAALGACMSGLKHHLFFCFWFMPQSIMP